MRSILALGSAHEEEQKEEKFLVSYSENADDDRLRVRFDGPCKDDNGDCVAFTLAVGLAMASAIPSIRISTPALAIFSTIQSHFLLVPVIIGEYLRYDEVGNLQMKLWSSRRITLIWLVCNDDDAISRLFCNNTIITS
jgi:hypothetical protein